MSTTRPRSRARRAASSTGVVGVAAGGQEHLVDAEAAGQLGQGGDDPLEVRALGTGRRTRRPAARPARSAPAGCRRRRRGRRRPAGAARRAGRSGPRPITHGDLAERHARPGARPAWRWRRPWRRRRAAGSTPSGTGTYRLIGTQLSSACRACSLPAQATRSPTAKPSTPAPTSIDRPAQRVAERGVGVEPVHHLLVGRLRALLGHALEHPAHLVRPGPHLAEQRQLGLAHLHQLGAAWRSASTRCGPARRPACSGARARRRRVSSPVL